MKTIFLGLLLLPVLLIAQQPLYYQNPILSGFYPDPSICKGADGFYMTNSTFAYFPGLPVFYSKDLVNWEQIGNAMDRNEQLPLAGAGVSRGLFAPAITYHKGVYYIVCTLVDKGGNFVITATDPKGPWSNPVFLPQVNGIDPSLFFDDNDSAYILYNSVPPDNKTLWNGHRTIRMYALDAKQGKVLGEQQILVNGGTDTAKHPVWIEGPHIYKVNGYYYLMCAEGGTGYNHSEVVFRSRQVWGPYESYSGNPILTQRHLDPKRPNPVTTTGHADMVQTDDGKWYAVFLGCRPYDYDYYNIGRETFMLPVHWKDGWPVILEGNELVGKQYPVPMPAVTKQVKNPFNGNLAFSDKFKSPMLNPRWIMLRNMQQPWYKAGNGLQVDLRPETVGGKGNPSFLAFRFQHHHGLAETSVRFSPTSENELAGLLLFQNETHFYFLSKAVKEGKPVLRLYQSSADSLIMQVINDVPLSDSETLKLRAEATGSTLIFSYSEDGANWKVLNDKVDARFLSTRVAGGFVGCVVGPYATSMGKASVASARFANFSYQGKDPL